MKKQGHPNQYDFVDREAATKDFIEEFGEQPIRVPQGYINCDFANLEYMAEVWKDPIAYFYIQSWKRGHYSSLEKMLLALCLSLMARLLLKQESKSE